jgi:hypothetical protein
MEKSIDDHFANTGSSIYMVDSIAVPNVRKIIESVATIIHAQIQEELNCKIKIELNSEFGIFSE